MSSIPENIGIATMPQPDKCSSCTTPIWRWNGTEWVCFNCKYYAVVYDHANGDLATLDGCHASGVYRHPPAQRVAHRASAQDVASVHVERHKPAYVPERKGVMTDTHLYYLSATGLVRVPLGSQISHVGTLLQICLDYELDTLWVTPETQVSDRATQTFVEYAEAGAVWDIKNAQYADGREYTDSQARATFLKAWKRKDARAKGESGRAVHLGFAEHNIRWELYGVTNPVHLLGALTYLEKALGFPLHYSPLSVGKRLMIEENQGNRAAWLAPVNLAAYPPLLSTKVTDIAWARPLSAEEYEQPFCLGADKNSMYPASCTSVMLGTGEPEHVERPLFDMQKSLPGVYYCRVSGTSFFDGARVPHPLEGLWKVGQSEGWLWTYSVKLLKEVGYTVEITEADVWPWDHCHTVLRPWAERLWHARATLDGRNPLCDTEQYPSESIRKLAYEAIKPVMNMSLGLLDAGRKYEGYESATQLYRPDWYALLKDNARYQMFWRIRSVQQKQGILPLGVLTDCLFYAASSDDHNAAFPGMFDRWDKLGGYKRKFARSIDLAKIAPHFDDPLRDITVINRLLLDYDKGTVEV